MFPGEAEAVPGDAPASSRLGKYQLLRRLATGGMAELFLARAQAMHGFEKLVVVKRILPQHAESEDFIRMFLAEARLAGTLHHPNIVQVYDIGEDTSSYFFTMEYVQGQDLRKLVRAARRQQRPIPLEHILHVIMGVAAGLNHAHEKTDSHGRPLGIVHRDVSPSNVLVTYEGDVKIVDFGIAKATTAQVATIAGTLKGKIPYMSPEQCRGEAVDRRSDIFSIGTLLWELTTGKRLFAGDNEFAILNRVAKGDVPLPSQIRPDYPPELEAIVMRALQADPEQRYAHAVDLQIDLEDFAREARLPVSSARMSRFMRELFAEEIRRAQEELRAENIEPDLGVPAPSSAPSAPPAYVSSPPEGISEYTPSELHRRHEATGGGGLEDSSGSGTDIAVDGVPGKVRAGPAIAIGIGFLATLGVLGGIAYKLTTNEPEPGVEFEPAPAIEVITRQPGSEPDPEPDVEMLPKPAAMPGPVTDEALLVEPPSEEAEAEAEEEAEAEAETSADSSEDGTEDGKKGQSTKAKPEPKPKPTRKKSSSRRSKPKPKPKPKPKAEVDIDAALPAELR